MNECYTKPVPDFRHVRLRWDKEDTRTMWWLLIAAYFILSLGANLFGILDPSDGYYSEGAREMMTSGNFLVPHLNYAWFFDKPILNYWLICLGFICGGGISEASSRIPAIVCAALTVSWMYFFSRHFF